MIDRIPETAQLSKSQWMRTSGRNGSAGCGFDLFAFIQRLIRPFQKLL